MLKHPTLTTPPESLPLAPPLTDTKPSDRVSQIIRHLRLRKAGYEAPAEPWTVIQLHPGDFDLLIALLKADEPLWSFIENRVRYTSWKSPAIPTSLCLSKCFYRYDYFSGSGRYVLRMPTTTHEFFRSSVVLDIQGQLGRIAAGKDDVAEFARNVKYRGSPRLHFPKDEVRAGNGDKQGMIAAEYNAHEPDAAFKHLDAQWPCIVIEVSFSQKEKELNDLAEDYILGSDGNIRVVIGLNIEYSQSQKATFSV
jgi:hypothetical protein